DLENKENPEEAVDADLDESSDNVTDENSESLDTQEERVGDTEADAQDTEALAEGEDVLAETDRDASDTVPPQASPTPPPAKPSTPGLVIGGLIAGAIGFVVATFAVPEGWPNGGSVDTADSEELSRATAELAAQSERLDALTAQLSEQPDAVTTVEVDLGPLETNLALLTERVDGLEVASSEMQTQVDALVRRPVAGVPDGGAAMEAQLEAFRSELDEVTEAARREIEAAQAEAQRISDEAASAEAAAQRRAAVASMRAALESGAPFADALAVLTDVPDDLAAVAGDGVATLAGLQADFPETARMALAQSQNVAEDASAGERLTAFLRRQTNARSLSPRDGEDADAVLSRAEAALQNGDLDVALEELTALPEAAQAVFGDWIASAEARNKAETAAAALSASVE
ncbi:MAG: hypothetical protein AAF762_12295, partial [Pseudomonadota bacterium]